MNTTELPTEKLAHTKSLLTAIYGENRPDTLDSVDSALLTRAVQHLAAEQEDELRELLKSSFGSPDDVRVHT